MTTVQTNEMHGSETGDSSPPHEIVDNPLLYCRRDRSLNVLCANFLQMYGQSPVGSLVCLDVAAEQLGVKRRRIYEIVNVLESVGVVKRMGKNKYSWHGSEKLHGTLRALKKAADAAADGAKAGHQTGARKWKSLGNLTQRFIMLFLREPDNVVTLEDAAKRLMPLGEEEGEGKLKTKVKRLYDIANILTSLGLISKVGSQGQGRKPAFRWKSSTPALTKPRSTTGTSPVASAVPVVQVIGHPAPPQYEVPIPVASAWAGSPMHAVAQPSSGGTGPMPWYPAVAGGQIAIPIQIRMASQGADGRQIAAVTVCGDAQVLPASMAATLTEVPAGNPLFGAVLNSAIATTVVVQ